MADLKRLPVGLDDFKKIRENDDVSDIFQNLVIPVHLR